MIFFFHCFVVYVSTLINTACSKGSTFVIKLISRLEAQCTNLCMGGVRPALIRADGGQPGGGATGSWPAGPAPDWVSWPLGQLAGRSGSHSDLLFPSFRWLGFYIDRCMQRLQEGYFVIFTLK